MANALKRLDGKSDISSGTTGLDVSGKHTITPHTKPSNLTLWNTKMVPAVERTLAKAAALVERQARVKAKIVREDTPTGLSE